MHRNIESPTRTWNDGVDWLMRCAGRDSCRIHRRRMRLVCSPTGKKDRHCPARSQKQETSGGRLQKPQPDSATQPTHHPNLEPASASTDDRNPLDRDNPAPIKIETGISSSPASHAAHDARARRSPAKAAIKHLTPSPVNLQRNSLPPVKSAFAYFCRD